MTKGLLLSEREELRAVHEHQPVPGGHVISPHAMRWLIQRGLVIYWEDIDGSAGRSGYVLTDAGRAEVSRLIAYELGVTLDG